MKEEALLLYYRHKKLGYGCHISEKIHLYKLLWFLKTYRKIKLLHLKIKSKVKKTVFVLKTFPYKYIKEQKELFYIISSTYNTKSYLLAWVRSDWKTAQSNFQKKKVSCYKNNSVG